MNDFHHAYKRNAPLAGAPAKPSGRSPMPSIRRLLAGFLALAALAGPAAGADITATPPVGGGFTVTDSGKTVERLRVNEDGSVLIPGLASSLGGDGWVCFNSATGKLGKCSAPTVDLASKIYTKQTSFYIAGLGVESHVFECDSMTDKVIGGVASLHNNGNHIAVMSYSDYFFRVTTAGTYGSEEMNVTFTCMRTQ